jgi:hypothetical protein
VQPGSVVAADWMLRKKLEETAQAVSNQLGKPTQRPTLKWIFQKFININKAIIELKGIIRRRDMRDVGRKFRSTIKNMSGLQSPAALQAVMHFPNDRIN